jgi:hypothetical protein
MFPTPLTAQLLINGAFLDLGATAAGETPNASESADAFTRLNQLILSLNIEGATLWTEQVDTAPLTAGTAAYTMGPTGAAIWNPAVAVTGRPTRINAARCMVGTTYGRGLKIITDAAEWAAIVERDLALTLPIKCYVDYAYPLATLHFWPAPTVAAVLTIDTIEAFGTIAPDTPAPLQAPMGQTLLRNREVVALIANTGKYTMGPGGTLAATSRPAQILSMHVGFGAYGHDIDIIGAAEWAALIEAENNGIILPLMLYPQFQFPNATLNFWPVPGAGVTAEIHSPYQIPQFALLSTTIASLNLPIGFERMLHLALAVDLYPSYRRASGIPPELPGDLADAKAALIAGNVSSGQTSLQAAAPPK